MGRTRREGGRGRRRHSGGEVDGNGGRARVVVVVGRDSGRHVIIFDVIIGRWYGGEGEGRVVGRRHGALEKKRVLGRLRA